MPEFLHNGKSYNNPVELALELVGGKWKMPILWRIKERPQRYGAIKKTLPKTSHKMLAQQLQELERDGLVRRKVFATVPPAVEYSLTARGKSAIPVIGAIRDWGESIRRSAKQEPAARRKGTSA